MKIYRVISHTTSSSEPNTEINDLVGTEVPYAFLLNYGNFGYAKFQIDNKSLAAFE